MVWVRRQGSVAAARITGIVVHGAAPGATTSSGLCGRWLRGALGAVALVGLALSSCAKPPRASLGQLQQRAVLDAACPAQWLSLQHLDARTKVVSGCGVRLVYVESCEDAHGRTECSWLLDSARPSERPGSPASQSGWAAAEAPRSSEPPRAGWGAPGAAPAAASATASAAPASPSGAPTPQGVSPPSESPWFGPMPSQPPDSEYRPAGL